MNQHEMNLIHEVAVGLKKGGLTRKGKDNNLKADLQKRGTAIEDFCAAMVITTDHEYSLGDAKATELAALEKGVKDYWMIAKDMAYKTWKDICEKEADMLLPVQRAKKVTTSKLGIYKAARDKQEAESREAEQELNRREQEIEAFKLAEEGHAPEVVEAIMEQAAESNVQMAPSVPQLKGKTSFKVGYEVELVPGQLYSLPLDILVPTTKGHVKAVLAKAKAQAQSTGGKPIPGIKITQIQKAKTRSS